MNIHDINYIGGLQQENARLKAEVARLESFCTRTIIPNEILKAEVARLCKAGDAMADAIETASENGNMPHRCLSVIAWLSAKEGKPSV